MSLLSIFITFFKVGLFTIGGGLVAIPIMQEYVLANNWVSEKAFIDMIAISQSTPGPIGINMATYVGQTQYGLLGSIIATLGMILPSFIIISIVSKFLMGFSEKPIIKWVLKNLRALVVGIILAAAYFIGKIAFINSPLEGQALLQVIDIKSISLFAFSFLIMFKVKIHPILYILLGGIIGVFLF